MDGKLGKNLTIQTIRVLKKASLLRFLSRTLAKKPKGYTKRNEFQGKNAGKVWGKLT